MKSTKGKNFKEDTGGAGEKGSGRNGENAEGGGKGKTEVIMPFLPGDLKLYKRTDGQGNVTYNTIAGKEIKTYSEELDFSITCMFERLEKLRDIIFRDDDCDCTLKDIFSSVIFHERLRFEEMFIFISRNVGTIECTGIAYDETGYRPERIVDASLIPPDPDEGHAEPLYCDVDPDIIELLKQIPPEKMTSITCILQTLARGQSFQWWPLTGGDAEKGKRSPDQSDGARAGKSGEV